MGRKRKSEKLRGALRMKEQGYKLVSVWLDKSELSVCEEAAALVGKKLATFLREGGFGAACVVLDARDNHLSPNEATWQRMVNASAKGAIADAHQEHEHQPGPTVKEQPGGAKGAAKRGAKRRAG